MGKRKYAHVKELEPAILQMRKEGKTRREIAEHLGLTMKRVKSWINRYNRKQRKRMLTSSQSINVNSQKERTAYDNLASRWFSDFSKALTSYGVNENAIKKYNTAFKEILKLASSPSRRESYSKQFNVISSSFNDDIIIFLQTEIEDPQADDGKELGDEARKLLADFISFQKSFVLSTSSDNVIFYRSPSTKSRSTFASSLFPSEEIMILMSPLYLSGKLFHRL